MSGLQASSIKCYLSDIRQLHIAWGMGDPGFGKMARLEQVLKGIKSSRGKEEEVNPLIKPCCGQQRLYAFLDFCAQGRFVFQERRPSMMVLI